MDHNSLQKLIDIAAGRRKADLVIKGGSVADVYNNRLIKADVAISDEYIAGIGLNYEGEETIDIEGAVISPGFIDSHIHIESSYMTPEEFGRLVVPLGTTTIIADPHEITNVCGEAGLDYMINAAENTALNIRYMVPSCVPATPFETSGAALDSSEIRKIFEEKRVQGLAEFMNSPGVINADSECIEKLLAAKEAGKIIDGHCPVLVGNPLNAYISAGIKTDHECSDRNEMLEKISKGMYILLRHGSACHDLEQLLPAVTSRNSTRCLLCSDDLQVHTIKERGHINSLLRIAVQNGIAPFDAIRMATLNAAECYALDELGAIAPGKRANIAIVNSITDFQVLKTFIDGRLVAENGKYLMDTVRCDAGSVSSSVNVADFSLDRLKLSLKSNKVKVIDILPGGVLTEEGIDTVALSPDNDFVYEPEKDIVKIAVVERHHGTGNVATALLRGYGIKNGAAALSVAHDSHNIIAAGTSDEDIEAAVKEIIRMKGGMTLIQDGKPLISIPLPVAGLMSTMNAEEFDETLKKAHEIAHHELKIHESVEPFMTLCFMSLPVIPELKLTDKGLFDVSRFKFTEIEAEQ